MPTPLKGILRSANQVAKQKLSSVFGCPFCGERQCLVKWGFYTRYLFDGDEAIKIQRVRCLNRQCPLVTFSLLPHPLLPVLRVPLCFLQAILRLHQNGSSIAELAQDSGKSWAVIRRCLKRARRIQCFLRDQVQTTLGTCSPCLNPAIYWTRFTRMFSWAFFPELHRKTPPT
jgi:transposase-like protein